MMEGMKFVLKDAVVAYGCMLGFCFQAVEGVVLLPENKDFSEIGVKSKELHFITAGSKGSPPVCLSP